MNGVRFHDRRDAAEQLARRLVHLRVERPIVLGLPRGGVPVAAIVARELLISGLRLAAVERGVVIKARELGKLKTWSQAVAAALGGFAAAGAWDQSIAWWGLLVAVVLTWVSGLDYARFAPSVLRGGALA